jgi:hypothetical protein
MSCSRVFRGFLALSIACGWAGASAEILPNRTIANEGAIAADWKLANDASIVAPPYPAEYDSDSRPDACLAMQYTIYPDGTTGDFRVLRAWKSGPTLRGPMHPFWIRFARAGVAAVGQWRFAPRDPANVRPVTTVATLSFFGATVADAADLRAHCRITDLAVLLRDLDRRDTLLNLDIERENRKANAALRMKALTP